MVSSFSVLLPLPASRRNFSCRFFFYAGLAFFRDFLALLRALEKRKRKKERKALLSFLPSPRRLEKLQTGEEEEEERKSTSGEREERFFETKKNHVMLQRKKCKIVEENQHKIDRIFLRITWKWRKLTLENMCLFNVHVELSLFFFLLAPIG